MITTAIKPLSPNLSSKVKLKSITFESSSTHYNVRKAFEAYSFKDGNDVYIRTSEDGGVWTNLSNSDYSKETSYLVKAVLCSFTYDTYEAVLGKVRRVIFREELYKQKVLGTLDYNI